MRTGALSDEAIREACSEFFPVPMSAYNLLMVNHSNQSIHQFRKSKYTQAPAVPKSYFAMSNSMAKHLDPTNDGALVSRLNQQFRNETRLPPANPPQQPPPQPPGTGGGGGGGGGNDDDDDDDDDDNMQGGGDDGNVTEEETFEDAEEEAPDTTAPNLSTPVRPQAGQAGSSTDPLPETNQVENVAVDSTPASQQQIIEPQNEIPRATNYYAENYHSGVEGGTMPEVGSNPPNNTTQQASTSSPPSNVDDNYTPTFTRYEPTITSGELSARPARISDTQRQLTHTLGAERNRMSSVQPTPSSAERTNVVVDGQVWSANEQGVREDLVTALHRNQIQNPSLRRNKTPRPESEAQAQAQSIAYNQAQAAQQEDQSMDVDEPQSQGTRQSERLKGKPRKRYGK